MSNGNEAGTTDDTIDPRTGLPYAASTTSPQQGLLGGFRLNVPQPSAVPFNQTYAGQPAPYANNYAQIADALGMASRYAQGPTWDNGAGRYANANGSAYSPTAGHNAPWGVNVGGGIGPQAPTPYHVPAFNGGLLGGQPNAHPAGGPQVATDPSFNQQPTPAPGGYTPTFTPSGPMGGGAALGRMDPRQAAMKQAQNAQQRNAMSLLPQYQALTSDPARASFLAQNPYFTQQAMGHGLLSPQTVNGLAAGGAPYVGG